MTQHQTVLESISEQPRGDDIDTLILRGKIRSAARTPPVITNRYLLYGLSAFLWIFRLFLRYVPVLPAGASPNMRFPIFGVLDSAKNRRLRQIAAKIAALDDSKMREAATTPNLSAPSASTTSSTLSGSSDRAPSAHPCRSVTLKARITQSMEAVEAAVFSLMDTIGNVTKQEDIFFDVPYGQMKLRISHSTGKDNGELISYKQTNNTGPNFSESRVTQVSDAQYLRTTLALSLSELGTITKKRRVYEKDNTRICLDEVDELGCFIDIDIKCDGGEKRPAAELLKQMSQIRKALRIKERQLVPFSYFELMQQKMRNQQEASTASEHNGPHASDMNSMLSGSMVLNSSICDDGESGISEGGSYIS